MHSQGCRTLAIKPVPQEPAKASFLHAVYWSAGLFMLASSHIHASPIANALGAQGASFYVATNGSDASGNGSSSQPWGSITFALDQVSDGSTIIVRPGLYQGRVRIRGQFDQGVIVRAEVPYQSRLRHNNNVVTIWNDNNDVYGITLSGFDIAHSGAGAGPVVTQVQDGANADTYNITLSNNVFHDSFDNDILKVNNGTSQVRVIGNLFYNQTGSDEHIDINSVDDVLVEGNVFFNAFEASNRPNNNDTSSYIVVKDSNGNSDDYLGANNVRIRRNVFLNWQGNTGSNFILCGEDGQPFYETQNMLIENNLLLGNSNNTMRAAMGVKGCRNVTVRANTVRGNLPSLAYAMRLNREGSNPANDHIEFFNNIWADSSGSMDDFSDTPLNDTLNFQLRRNLYWNQGNPIPSSNQDLINVGDDLQAIIDDPGFNQTIDNISLPYWQPQTGLFNGGAESIADVFTQLVLRYGLANGAGVDQADSSQMPSDDILGLPRGTPADLGALEQQSAQQLFQDGFEIQ
jgi:hypothetical protein